MGSIGWKSKFASERELDELHDQVVKLAEMLAETCGTVKRVEMETEFLMMSLRWVLERMAESGTLNDFIRENGIENLPAGVLNMLDPELVLELSTKAAEAL